MYLKFLCILLVSCLSAVSLRAQPAYYAKWAKFSTPELIDYGANFAELESKPDSALVCFTIAAGRYQENASKEEKHYAAVAYSGRWYVYFFHYFDYANAYENLQRSFEIAKENGDPLQRIFLNFGCMFQTISEQSGELRPCQQAADYYRQSFEAALAAHDSVTLDMAMINLCTVSHTLGEMGKIRSYYQRYLKEGKGRDLHSPYRYTLLLYEGLLAMEQKRADRAIAAFRQQSADLSRQGSYLRYHYGARLNLAKAYAAKGLMDEALPLLQESEKVAEKYDMKDARLEVYRLIADYAEANGNGLLSETYRNRFFRLKDTLLNYRQVVSVSEQRFLGEMRDMDKQIAAMAHERNVQRMLTLVALGIVLLVIVFLLLLWVKNRKLGAANRALYEKNLAVLRREEEERKRRKEFETMLEEMKRNPADDAAQKEGEKYRGSWLDDEDKQLLGERILDVVETSGEIYSPDFSADRLAQLTGINYRYLSQVINERFGVNFNTFVNEYRIREACKRFNDTRRYGQYTIEAVAHSVGFSSRSSFFTSFKKFTGLTPSAYQKMARERENAR